jgi:hypothetical protein
MSTLVTIDFETSIQAALFLEHGGLPALGVSLKLTKQEGTHIEYQGDLSTRLWDGCRDYAQEYGGLWTAVSVLDLDEIDEQASTSPSHPDMSIQNGERCTHAEDCPYTPIHRCSVCGTPLCFIGEVIYNDRVYCAAHMPAYDKHQQW